MSDTEIEIVWRDPPPKQATGVWVERLAPLRERPSTWARIRTGTPGRMSGLRQRLARNVGLKDIFEFRTARISDNEAELYARFVGGPSAV